MSVAFVVDHDGDRVGSQSDTGDLHQTDLRRHEGLQADSPGGDVGAQPQHGREQTDARRGCPCLRSTGGGVGGWPGIGPALLARVQFRQPARRRRLLRHHLPDQG